MNARRLAAPACVLALASGLALGQSPDMAAERARLANERIQVEAERHAREEAEAQQRAAAAAQVTSAAPTAPVRPPSIGRPASPGRSAAENERIERALLQLQQLGELRDAGYVTAEEFQRIKQRILDARF